MKKVCRQRGAVQAYAFDVATVDMRRADIFQRQAVQSLFIHNHTLKSTLPDGFSGMTIDVVSVLDVVITPPALA